jgi:hypothetical protein
VKRCENPKKVFKDNSQDCFPCFLTVDCHFKLFCSMLSIGLVNCRVPQHHLQVPLREPQPGTATLPQAVPLLCNGPQVRDLCVSDCTVEIVVDIFKAAN